MPLYIKLDVAKTGLIHAWVTTTKDELGSGLLKSCAFGKSTAQVLRALAKKIPLAESDKNG